LVGGRERLAILIVDYDQAWSDRFEVERRRVDRALGDSAIRIEHFGSTAVPGLAAKPIIDVLVTVENPEADDVLVPRLEAAGYWLRVREPGHRMFRTPGGDVHLHVWGDADPEVSHCLGFRDRLRESREDREAYERLKRELARSDWADMNDYANAKTGLIAEILAKANLAPRDPR